MTTFSRWKNRAHIWWEESCWTWLERGTRMLFLSSFSHVSSPLLQASSLSLSTSLSAKSVSLPSCLPPVPALSASSVPRPNITASQQWWEGAKSGADPHVQPTALSQAWCCWWLWHRSWPSSPVVANLFYRWDGIFAVIVLEILSRHFASARHNLCGAT